VSFRERLLEPKPILLDGGFGSALIARGLPPGTPPDLWNLERGADVTAVHRSYVDAGSDAVHTNSFGANPVRLAQFGLAGRCEEINRAAVALARAAEPRFVIGDVGPGGDYLPPVGRANAGDWRASFERQGRALAEAGVDAFHLETMSDLREALVALEALLDVAPAIPVLASMTFDRKKRGFFTVMGDALAPTLGALAAAGASAVGANCSVTSLDMIALMTEAVAGSSVPLVAQPNAGTPEQAADGSFSYGQAPDGFAADMATIGRLGVRAVGGCCGTDARFIAALRAELDRSSGAKP